MTGTPQLARRVAYDYSQALQTLAHGEPTIELHVSVPTLRLPVWLARAWAERGIEKLEAWKKTAPGAQLALYGTLKLLCNGGLPLLSGFLGAAADAGMLPPLPPRPRHSDPVIYLGRYLAEVLPTLAARAPWTLHADPATGIAYDLDWGGFSMTTGEQKPPEPVIVEEGA